MASSSTLTLYRGAAATSNTTLYSSPPNVAVAVTNIAITNTAASSATATINLATVALVSSIPIPANTTQLIDLDQVIYNNETITGSASATTVNFHIAGSEIF